MTIALILIPMALALAALWLGIFFWSLRKNQFEDLEGAANRILFDDDQGATPPKA